MSQKPKVENADRDVPTWMKPEQVTRMLDVIPRASPDYLQLRDEALCLLTYDAGLRASEAVALDVDDLRLEADEPHLVLPAAKQKGDYAEKAFVELRPSLGTARTLNHYLKSRWKDTEALFPTRSSDRMTTQSFNNLVTKLATAADVRPFTTADNEEVGPEHVSPHTLRHSLFYREFVKDGKRLKEVSMRLRHRRVSTTEDHYQNLIMV